MKRLSSVPSDIEIAQVAELKPISAIAENIGIPQNSLIQYGKYKAKIDWRLLRSQELPAPKAKYINVTAISPTPLGEGKTTTSVGLVQRLGAIGKKAVAALRQPSMGPTFGIKGGAAGGDINTMPRLPSKPAFMGIDIDGDGNVSGLF